MSTDLTKSNLDNVPAHIKEDKVQGVSDIKNFVRPPRMKIVQFIKGDAYDKFDPGTVLVVPQIQEIKMPFLFTPLFFFPEWCVWNPLEMKGQLPVIRERSLDPAGELANKSRDKSTRSWPCPENDDYKCVVSEHLTLIVMIHGDTPVQNVPVVLNFLRGEYGTGTSLLSMIQLRQQSIYSCVFEANVDKKKPRTNAKGKWFGFDFTNPTEVSPWVDDNAVHLVYKGIHESLALSHSRNEIKVDHDDRENREAATADAETF